MGTVTALPHKTLTLSIARISPSTDCDSVRFKAEKLLAPFLWRCSAQELLPNQIQEKEDIGHLVAVTLDLRCHGWERATFVDSNGNHVNVGNFDGDGLNVNNWNDDDPNSNVGVASSRQSLCLQESALITGRFRFPLSLL